MPSRKPLSYGTRKIVLERMEPNRRFKLAQHCPSIRTTEKAVPLKLDYLYLDNLLVRINETEYRFDSYFKYPKGVEVPLYHQCLNKGNFMREYDEFGVQKSAYYSDSCNEFWIECYSKQIDELLKDEKKKHDVEKLSEFQTIMQAYQNRRDNIMPEFDVIPMLTISFENTVRLQFFNKTSDLGDLMKGLLTSFFGGRSRPVGVGSVEINRELVLTRLPRNVKFNFRALTIDFIMEMKKLNEFIDENMEPLDTLNVMKELDSNLDHPLEKAAKKLHVRCRRYSPALYAKLPNREVLLSGCSATNENLATLIENVLQHWIQIGREIGTTFSIAIYKGTHLNVMDIVMDTIEMFGAVRKEATLIEVPMNFMSKIEIQYGWTVWADGFKKFAIKLMVVPIDSE